MDWTVGQKVLVRRLGYSQNEFAGVITRVGRTLFDVSHEDGHWSMTYRIENGYENGDFSGYRVLTPEMAVEEKRREAALQRVRNRMIISVPHWLSTDTLASFADAVEMDYLNYDPKKDV